MMQQEIQIQQKEKAEVLKEDFNSSITIQSETHLNKFKDMKSLEQARIPTNNLLQWIPSQKQIMAMVTLLFMIKGLILGFFEGSIPTILIQSNATWSQLELLSFATLPWALKFFIAPIFDSYYSTNIGKRKSYIIPFQLISVIILFATCGSMESWITNLNVCAIFLTQLLLNVCYANQDICAQGMCVELLKDENVIYIPTITSVGTILGGVISKNLYIWLNSPEYLNQEIGTHLKSPILYPGNFMFMVATFILFQTIFLLIFKERDQYDQEEILNEEQALENGEEIQIPNNNNENENPYKNQGFLHNLNRMKGFYQNENLRMMIIFFLTDKLMSAPIDNLSGILLLQNGFKRQVIATFSFIMIPVSVIAAIAASRVVKIQREWSCIIVCKIIRYFNDFLKFLLVINFSVNGPNKYLIGKLLLVNGIIRTILSTFALVASSGFNFRMCDKTMAGTYITLLASAANFGGQWVGSLVIYLENYVCFQTQYFASLIFYIFYMLYWGRIIMKWEKTEKKDWSL